MIMRFVRYFLVCVLFLITGIVYAGQVPKIKKWILNKIEIVSRDKAQLEVRVQQINFQYFPLGVQLEKLSVLAHGSLASALSPVSIDSIEIQINPLALMGGRLEISKVIIEHPVTSVFIAKQPKPKSVVAPGPTAWDQIMTLPLRSVVLNNAEVKAKIEPLDLLLELKNFGLIAAKNDNAGKVEIFAPELSLKKIGSKDQFVSVGLATRIVAERNALEIAALKINQGQNYIIARALARGDTTKLEFPLVNGKTVGHVDIKELSTLVALFIPDAKLPAMSGLFNFEVRADQHRGQAPVIDAEIELQNAKVSHYDIGNLNTKFNYEADTVRSKEIALSGSAGKFKIQDFEAHIKEDASSVAGRVAIENLELRQVLINLGVSETPLHMDVTGTVPCEGTLTPEMKFTCAGELDGSKFYIHTPKGKNIVALRSFKLTTTMNVDKQKITFPQGLISIGDSSGVARGEVDYDKGFNFSYHSDSLSFSDIESLADLKYDGTMDITGVTSGDGHSAIMDAQILAKDFWFENYGLGNAHLGLRYEKDHLKFSDVAGQFGALNYNGAVDVKLSTDKQGPEGLVSAKLKMPVLDLAELQALFSRKVKLPFKTTGIGTGELDASGPFSLSELTYNLRANVQKGSVADEGFQELRFNVHGINGHAYTDDVTVKKNDGTFVMTGDVASDGGMNLNVAARNFVLTDFEHIKAANANVEAKLKFDMTMRDFILAPQVRAKGSLYQMTLNQQLLEDSDFDISFSPVGLKFDGQFFAQKIRAQLMYPFREDAPFSFKFNTTDWDFSNLLSLVGRSPIKRDYETSLSADVELQSDQGGFLKSSGYVDVSKFYVRHATSQMRNTGPISVRFDEGQVNVNHLQIDGDNTRLNITGSKNRRDALNFNINGRIDLSLLMFLTPFLRDMSGELALSTEIGGTLTKPDLLGSAFIKKGYFKLDALPQAFEDVAIDAAFSQSRILINRLGGHLGGGNLSASGSINLNGFRDIPVEISGDLLQTSLNMPEGLLTHGDFHFGITGNWFPYMLRGDYNISGGLFSQNIGEDSGDSTLKRSVYLPSIILQKDFSPLEVDINTHFAKGLKAQNNMVDAEARGNIEVKGDASHAILKGDIEAVPNGKIYFRETPFNITTAKLTFNNPAENNPVIYALGTTHIREWDISLLVSGTKQKMKIEVSSNPPLTEKSIISLLALGLTDEDEIKTTTPSVVPIGAGSPLQQNASVLSGQETTVQYSKAGNLVFGNNPLQTELKKRYGIIVRLTESVDDTHNVIMPRIVAEKQFTPTLTTSVSRSIGDFVTRDVNVEYKLNRHFSILGSYEGRDFDPFATTTALPTNSNISTDIFGMDLQYQVDFR